MVFSRNLSKWPALAAILICAMGLASPARAAVSEAHDDALDYYDWLEQRGYNPERDTIVEIGNWNRRELEGHWPETEFTYYEWLEVSEYYEGDE
jgi:hypothetical protein